MWIPPEVTDPVLWHYPTRQSVGYFGAVRLRDGKLVYDRQEGRFNKETYFRFLQLLRRRACCSGRRVVVIVDNASIMLDSTKLGETCRRPISSFTIFRPTAQSSIPSNESGN